MPELRVTDVDCWCWNDPELCARGLYCRACCAEGIDQEEWPVHQPDAPEAPIPGRHWYSGCDPDRPRVNPATGICTGCGAKTCRICGRDNCPDHPEGEDMERTIAVRDGGLAVSEMPDDFDEDDSLGDLIEPDDPEPDAEQENNTPEHLRSLAVNLRDAADAIERMADTEHTLPPDLSGNFQLTFYTFDVEHFKGLSRALGGLRKKGGSGSAFWVQRHFGRGYGNVDVTVFAPDREKICTPKVVGTREVEEKIYVSTGRTVEEDIIEWDCGSVLGETPAEEQHIDAQVEAA